ncbi:PREDICTED: methyl-CpG-binding domain-containing protein 13 isoform X3 [Populus euphratica]|uniref:Methyl-CpG-binding domain-containing protein 13 isoform X3 n=1 Tax=Populus euphratica TaxID=75702 RepID=A0AAJ6YB22_POPEU|nr:PREDICTED: methyl-CpG-binding domain-containing protein 13 isoform X3 [Populus euphratica]
MGGTSFMLMLYGQIRTLEVWQHVGSCTHSFCPEFSLFFLLLKTLDSQKNKAVIYVVQKKRVVVVVFSVAGDHCLEKTTVGEMGDPKSDDWLPEGWRVEVKVRDNGKKDKFYFPPTGGLRFNSKIEVSRYLNGSHPKSEEKEGSNDQRSSNKVVIEKTVPEGLPLGWTKEIKVTKKGGRIRRDPFYTDPVSGYVFRSMKGAHRYIESGGVGRLAFKRNRKDNYVVELKDDKTCSLAVAKKQDLEVNETPSPVTGDQSLKACEIAKHEQILNSASTGERIIVSEHTSDQYESVAKKQKLEVNRTQSSIISDHRLKSCEIAQDEHSLNLASAGEYTAVSEHASDQCVSVAKKQKLEVSGMPSPIISDRNWKSCVIAKVEQIHDSASRGECNTVSVHTSNQCVSATKKQRLAVDRSPSSIISDQSLKSCEISEDKQILASSSTGECTAVSKHTPIQCGVGTESSSSEFPEDKGSNQTEEKSDFVRASFVEDPSRGVPEDKLLLEVGETRKEIKRAGLRKSKNKNDINLPRRASKRLAGIPLAPTPELKAITRVRRAAVEPGNEVIASTSEQASCGELDTELNTKNAFDTSKSTEMPVESNESKHGIVDMEHAGKAGSGKEGDEKHECAVVSSSGKLAAAEHGGKIETANNSGEKPGLPFDLPLEELWQDPCIAFAIKTLTEAPVDSDSIKVSPGSSNNEFLGMAALDEHAGKEDIGNNGNLFIPEHARGVETSNKADEKPVSPLNLPFADVWSDPCIEFAIKTLTGAIPLDFDVVQDCLPQQAGSSQQQQSSGFTLPKVGPALPHAKHVNLGYSAGPSRRQHSEERSNKRRR